MKCERCGAETPLAKHTGKPRRFCSQKCSHAAWVDENRDRRKEHLKKYDSSEHGRQRRKRWEKENEEDQRQYKKNQYAKNREKRLLQATEYAKKNRESVHKYKLAWQKTEKGRKASLQSTRRRIARKMNATGSHTIDEFYEICAEHEDHCLMCLKKFERKELSIDHVVPLSCGGSDSSDNLQPLCRVCNATKGTLTVDFRPTYWWRGPSEM